MIISKVRRLLFEKQQRDRRKLTYSAIMEEAGLTNSTFSRLLSDDPIERIDANTLDALCRYFDCQIGEVLEFRDERTLERGRVPVPGKITWSSSRNPSSPTSTRNSIPNPAELHVESQKVAGMDRHQSVKYAESLARLTGQRHAVLRFWGDTYDVVPECDLATEDEFGDTIEPGAGYVIAMTR